MTSKSLIVLLLFSVLASAQQLQYLRGASFSYNGEKLDARQLEFLLSKTPALSDRFDTAKTKRDIGNVLYVTGAVLAGGSLVMGLTSDHFSPAAAIAGGGAILLAIPIKAGFRKRMQDIASAYNQKIGASALRLDTFTLCAGKNSIGCKVTF
jgi:hypothetical protein